MSRGTRFGLMDRTESAVPVRLDRPRITLSRQYGTRVNHVVFRENLTGLPAAGKNFLAFGAKFTICWSAVELRRFFA
jgi:hypothetical protein